MNPKLNQFILAMLKTHMFDLATVAVAIVCTFGLAFFFINKNDQYSQSIQTQQSSIDDLKKKADIIQYQQNIQNSGIDIDSLNAVFGKLVPDQEDYYSIILAIETLAQKSGFIITSYGLNLGSTNTNRLALTIEGQGSQDTFLEFLKNYNFGGGRLITIDNVSYANKGKLQVRLQMTFYSGKTAVGGVLTSQKLTDADRKLLQQIQQKVKVELIPAQTETTNLDYPTKTNPFATQ